MARQPRLWKLAVFTWQSPKIRGNVEQCCALIDPTGAQQESGQRKWCRVCVELALITGGEWKNEELSTDSGTPERIGGTCIDCDFEACEHCLEDHEEETGHRTQLTVIEGGEEVPA